MKRLRRAQAELCGQLFEALKGNGGTVRWVVLPLEEHGYRARESLLHMLWEQQEWLSRYLGGAE